MRNLTIKREKSFVACLASMKIYIEDPVSGQLVINGVNCSKLGELKNGEEKTFLIGDDAAKVFVIADKLSRNISNEYYQIEPGSNDILLIGKNKYNPLNGNAFLFYNNDGKMVVENRKKGTKKGAIVMLCALCVGILAGLLFNLHSCLPKVSSEKVFRADSMEITLDRHFMEMENEKFLAVFGNENMTILVEKVDFSVNPSLADYTVQQYGNTYVRIADYDSAVHTEDDLTFFEYENVSSDGTLYHFTVYLYKADDAFFHVQFGMEKDTVEKNKDDVRRYAGSVCFPSEN